MLLKILLACGPASSLLYMAATIAGAAQWKSYDWTSLSISELFALDAPSRALVAGAFLAYSVLVTAFGVGVLRSAGARRGLRVAGAALVGYGVIGETGPLFFSLPTMVRGVQATQSDVTQVALHATVALALVLLVLLSLGFGAAAFGLRFRLYSVVTVVAVVVGGILSSVQMSAIAADLPTPWLGVEERFNVFGLLLWIAVFGIALLLAPGGIASVERPRPRPHGWPQVV